METPTERASTSNTLFDFTAFSPGSTRMPSPTPRHDRKERGAAAIRQADGHRSGASMKREGAQKTRREHISKACVKAAVIPPHTSLVVELPAIRTKAMSVSTRASSLRQCTNSFQQVGGALTLTEGMQEKHGDDRFLLHSFGQATGPRRKDESAEEVQSPACGRAGALHPPTMPSTQDKKTIGGVGELSRPHRWTPRKAESSQDYREATEPKLKARPHKNGNGYVDIVNRHAHLDLQGGLMFPARGAVRCSPRRASFVDEQSGRILRDPKSDAKTLRDYASWLHEQGRLKEAHQFLQASLQKEPTNTDTLVAIAMLFWDQRKQSKAEDMLKRALGINPKSLKVLLNYAIVNMHLKRFDAAIQYFSRVLDLDNEEDSALLGCAMALEDHPNGQQDLESIEAIYLKVLSKNPYNFDALCAYGRFLKVRRHDLEKARPYYVEALQIRPQDPNLLCSYAVLLMEGLNDVENATEQHLETFNSAGRAFKEVLMLEPENFAATYNFACLLSRWERITQSNGDFEEANDLRGAGVKEVSAVWEANLQELDLSSLLVSEGRRSLAEHLYRKALYMQPKNDDAKCSFAMFLLNTQIHGEKSILEAEHLFKKVLQANPQHPFASLYYVQLLCAHRPDGYEKATRVHSLARYGQGKGRKKIDDEKTLSS